MEKAAQWRAKARAQADAAAVDLTLPSGMVIRARRPDPLQLAAWGAMPASLVGPASRNGAGEPAALSGQDMQQVAALYRDVLVWCCVEPRIALEPAEGEIHPREIPEADWRFIVEWALRVEEAESLRTFRGGRPDDGARVDGAPV